MIKVFSLDPGIASGFSHAVIYDDKVEVYCDEARWSHGQLWKAFEGFLPDWIVCESFEFRNRSRDNIELFSRELIGVSRLWAEQHNDCNLTMQTAAKGKGYYTDDKLKKAGVYKVGKHHGRDAVRHFLHWYTFGPGFQFNKEQKIVLGD